jgi:hypothetical protein
MSFSASTGPLNISGAINEGESNSDFFFIKFKKKTQFLLFLKSLQTDIDSLGLRFKDNKVSWRHISLRPRIESPFILTFLSFLSLINSEILDNSLITLVF